jgi:hypothetical protein
VHREQNEGYGILNFNSRTTVDFRRADHKM